MLASPASAQWHREAQALAASHQAALLAAIQAAGIVPAAETAMRWRYTMDQASALYAQGREGGNSYWPPMAEQRIAAFEAALAAWPER